MGVPSLPPQEPLGVVIETEVAVDVGLAARSQ